MQVKILPDVVLVSPLVPGQDLQAGDVAEVYEDTGREWIKRGWAVEVTAPGKEEGTDGSLSE